MPGTEKRAEYNLQDMFSAGVEMPLHFGSAAKKTRVMPKINPGNVIPV
jgi:hypothetical protein